MSRASHVKFRSVKTCTGVNTATCYLQVSLVVYNWSEHPEAVASAPSGRSAQRGRGDRGEAAGGARPGAAQEALGHSSGRDSLSWHLVWKEQHLNTSNATSSVCWFLALSCKVDCLSAFQFSFTLPLLEIL